MRAARFVDDRAYLETWRKHAIGIADDGLMRDNFLRDDDDPLACQSGLFADAQVSPRVRIPVKTISPSRISRAAAATMISWGV